jgi:hypothetical protein
MRHEGTEARRHEVREGMRQIGGANGRGGKGRTQNLKRGPGTSIVKQY